MHHARFTFALLGIALVACGDDGATGGAGGGTASSSDVSTVASNVGSSSVASTATTSTVTVASSGDVSSSSTGAPLPCGNSILDAGEECDDGNVIPGDGCSATCTLECPGVGEVEPNDDTMSATGGVVPGPGNCGAIDSASDVDFWSFTLTTAGSVSLQTFDASGNVCADIDTFLRLYDASGDELASNDDTGLESCSYISPLDDDGVRRLAAGTYYVSVEEYQNDAPIPGYQLVLTLESSCGDTVVEGFEDCDDGNTVDGDGCEADCTPTPVCGNGVVDTGEQCDDGNVLPDDGCSDVCQVECPGGGETEPNDGPLDASGPLTPGAGSCGAIDPGADVDFWSFTLNAPSDLILETFDGTGSACANIDTFVRLFDTDGVSEIVNDDDAGIDTCSRIAPSSDPVTRRLPAGTYFVSVEDYALDDVIPAYRLALTVLSACGDGVVQSTETCDDGNLVDGDGCDASCTPTPGCGTGGVDPGETCDDGNLAAGDGCSATCQIENLVPEAGLNDTIAQATANAIQITSDIVISGSITDGTDERDSYRLTLATDQVVRIETFGPTFGDCEGTTTTLLVRDAALNTLYVNDTAGIQACSAVTAFLAAGSYFISVDETGNNGNVPAYYLQVAFQTQAGTEAEAPGTSGANDTSATAETQLGGQTDVYILGDHTLGGMGISDRDVYAIEVPAGASVRAEIIEGDTDPTKTCESQELDAQLDLIAPDGTTVLVGDDDDGRGYCSLIDGTGIVARDAGARTLAGGTYFLEVRESGFAGGTADQFVYRLVVTVRRP